MAGGVAARRAIIARTACHYVSPSCSIVEEVNMLSAEQAQGIAMMMIQGLEQEIPITKKILAAVPQDKLGFQLGEKGRTAKDLMWHIVQSDSWFAEGIAAGEFAASDSKGDAPATAQDIASKYEKDVTAALARVKTMTGAQLAKPINFLNMMNLPAVMYLQFMNNHMVHHR